MDTVKEVEPFTPLRPLPSHNHIVNFWILSSSPSSKSSHLDPHHHPHNFDTNRMHAVKEVEPFAPLGTLSSNIVDPEDHVLDVEFHLNQEVY